MMKTTGVLTEAEVRADIQRHPPVMDAAEREGVALEAIARSNLPDLFPHPDDLGAVGKTLFDLPGSTDLTVTVVVPKDKLHAAPAQSLVRIKSRTDGRAYLGVVTAGPFAEPAGEFKRRFKLDGFDLADTLHLRQRLQGRAG